MLSKRAHTTTMRSRMDDLLPLAEQNDGLVTAAQARALGVADSVLARLTRRGKLERVARGVYHIPYFPANPLSQYREAILWVRANHGPEQVALSHETALSVYGISDVSPARVHLTVPKQARLRRQKPNWIVIHRGNLAPTEVTKHEDLPVTTVAKSVMDMMATTGRLGLARQAIKDARKEGYISAAELQGLTRKLNQHVRGSAQKTQATA